MPDCCILYRGHNGKVGAIKDGPEGEYVATFPSRGVALALIVTHPLLRAVIWQIVELDEL
jgi:hypothetical protein